jgi:hypothetical protein
LPGPEFEIGAAEGLGVLVEGFGLAAVGEALGEEADVGGARRRDVASAGDEDWLGAAADPEARAVGGD